MSGPASRARGGRRSRAAGGRSRAELLDEEGFLRRSLEDLDREHAAGDIDIADYDALRATYSARANAVAAELAGLAPVPDPVARSPRPAPSSHQRRVVLWAGVGCLLVAAILAGLAVAGVAPFAKSQPSFPVSTRIAIELGEASVLAAEGHVAQAITVYEDVLALDPHQPEALADGGWLVRATGLSAKDAKVVASGDAQIALAARLDPGYALARAYDGVALYDDKGEVEAAVAEFNGFLADHPTATLLKLVRPTAASAYTAVGAPLPPPLAASAAK